MPIIKNATSGGRPLEARQTGGPPKNWANQNVPETPAPPASPSEQEPEVQEEEQIEVAKEDKGDGATETSVEEWLNKLLEQAIDNRGSDIHFEPERDKISIRVRIDGFLHTMETLDFEFQEVIVSRIKILGQMDITKHRMPQDGGFEFQHKNRRYSMRISTYPTIYGEAAVLRILDQEQSLRELKDLGLDETQLKWMNRLILKPYGMILITGPSGSGKTTLLYSVLNILNTPENNIMTIEDPVEVQMNQIRQAQTNQYREFNFPTALRAVLRQDPDIVMVGEIRDKETAQISIQAALTGKLVFSTFHTLDVFAVVTRFIEMDIPRSVVAHTIEGIVSSRLVRQICPDCKTEYQPTEYEKRIVGDTLPPDFKYYKGAGCKSCAGTGYRGRIGIFEVVVFDDDIRTKILAAGTSQEMNALLKEKQVKSLRGSAIDKVKQGVTTLEEVIRVTA